MTAIREFIHLAAQQPPAWQGAIAAVMLVCATLVLVAFVEVLVLGLPWLREALKRDTAPAPGPIEQVARQQTHMCPPRTIAERERIVAQALGMMNQGPRL